MKTNANLFLSVSISIAIIIAIALFYNHFEDTVDSVFRFISLVIGWIIVIAISLFLLWVVFYYTNKWLTVGLDNDEKNGAVVILAISIFWALFYGISQLFTSYEEEISSGIYYLYRIALGTSIIFSLLLWFNKKISNDRASKNKKDFILFLSLLILALISSIILEYFIGDEVTYWLQDNWYYPLGILLLIVLASSIYSSNKKKPNP